VERKGGNFLLYGGFAGPSSTSIRRSKEKEGEVHPVPLQRARYQRRGVSTVPRPLPANDGKKKGKKRFVSPTIRHEYPSSALV